MNNKRMEKCEFNSIVKDCSHLLTHSLPVEQILVFSWLVIHTYNVTWIDRSHYSPLLCGHLLCPMVTSDPHAILQRRWDICLFKVSHFTVGVHMDHLFGQWDNGSQWQWKTQKEESLFTPFLGPVLERSKQRKFYSFWSQWKTVCFNSKRLSS